jgi:hypothetical protein
MSWVEAFGLGGVDVSNPGVADYSRGAIIQWGVGQGFSQNRIESELRGAGVGIQASVQRGLIQAEQARQGASLESTQLAMDYSTGTLLGGVTPENWTGQYVHQVTMTYQEQTGPRAYELHDRTVGLKSSVPLTPSQAIEAAFDIITPEPGEPGTPNAPDLSQVIMSQLTGVWYDTQGRNIRSATSTVA